MGSERGGAERIDGMTYLSCAHGRCRKGNLIGESPVWSFDSTQSRKARAGAEVFKRRNGCTFVEHSIRSIRCIPFCLGEH